jgi:NAD(P)-dependent dehydrogenase (short-subunit alcohol dehydrogenase family)
MANWLITGVSSGLGRSLAAAAIEAGHTVVGTVRSPGALAEFATLHPDRAIGMQLDVTDVAAVGAVVAEAERVTGGLDMVVNNAGHGYTGAIEETPIADAKAMFDVNLWGALAVIQAALPYLRARGAGNIVNVSSVSGLACWNGIGLYSASKFALDCLSRTLAQEVGALGIRVTTVAPGGMRTEFAADRLPGAAATIADYEETGHLARQSLLAGKGTEPSDPDLAAQAILNALAEPEPPLLLLLGKDALKYFKMDSEMLHDQADRWRDLTLSVAAEPIGAH